MPRRKQLFIFILILLVLITGCQRKNPVEEMYDVLENVVSKEKTFEEQQKPLTELEAKEKNLYGQIISLGVKEYDKIETYSKEAIDSAEQRKKLLEKETDSLKESEQAFNQVKPLKGKLVDSKLKKSADQLYKTMKERYRAHDSLYKEYKAAINNDIQLYKMFQNKDIAAGELEEQVKKANESYNKVYAANEKFNNLTKDYNKKKLSFYKQAGLPNNK